MPLVVENNHTRSVVISQKTRFIVKHPQVELKTRLPHRSWGTWIYHDGESSNSTATRFFNPRFSTKDGYHQIYSCRLRFQRNKLRDFFEVIKLLLLLFGGINTISALLDIAIKWSNGTLRCLPRWWRLVMTAPKLVTNSSLGTQAVA